MLFVLTAADQKRRLFQLAHYLQDDLRPGMVDMTGKPDVGRGDEYKRENRGGRSRLEKFGTVEVETSIKVDCSNRTGRSRAYLLWNSCEDYSCWIGCICGRGRSDNRRPAGSGRGTSRRTAGYTHGGRAGIKSGGRWDRNLLGRPATLIGSQKISAARAMRCRGRAPVMLLERRRPGIRPC